MVFLFLHGGPTQYETWDPKMEAPDGIRSMSGEVQTQLPGVTFGGSFSRLGAMANKLAVVRSFRVGSGSHGPGRQLITNGNNPTQATMGAIYASLTGSTNPLTGMPNNIILPPRSTGAEFANLDNRVEEVQLTGRLSPEFRAFDPQCRLRCRHEFHQPTQPDRRAATMACWLTCNCKFRPHVSMIAEHCFSN